MMATQILCDVCEQEPAKVMQSNLDNGDSIAIGDNCWLPFLLSLATAALAEMPAEVRAAHAQYAADLINLIGEAVMSDTNEEEAEQAADDDKPEQTQGSDGNESSDGQAPQARPARRSASTEQSPG